MTLNSPHQPFNASPPTSILLVDDHRPNLLALEAMLDPLGHRLVCASSGEEALRRMLEEDFAVILMDVHMPGLDGFETGALIRSRPRNRNVPIIFLSAVNKELEHIFRGFEHGGVDYVLKPFNPDVLRAKVSALLDLQLQGERVRVQESRLRALEREALLQQNEQRFRRVLDAMPIPVWAARRDGRIYHANDAARIYSRCAPQEGSDTFAFEEITMLHPDDLLAVCEAWEEALRTSRPLEIRYRLLPRGDEDYRWHVGRFVPERDGRGELVGWILTATDVDAQRMLLVSKETRADGDGVGRAIDGIMAAGAVSFAQR